MIAPVIERLARILYAMEFLLALMAVFTVWSEVGGRGHLDYMAWYWKAGIGLPAAFAVVRLTAAFGSEGRRRRILAWGAVLILLTICAALVTYYYHLNEPQDEETDQQGAITETWLPPHGRVSS